MIYQTHSFNRPHEAGVSPLVLPGVPVDTCRYPSIPVDEPLRNHAAGASGNNSSRRGVALVIVLGMLSLLMILGVAFSITMRTERMSANYYMHQVRGEHLGHVALARAVTNINNQVGVYPDWEIMVSQGDDPTPVAAFLTEEVRRHLPGLDWDGISTNVGWISDPSGDTIGQYAYVVLNTSGLLDANHAGGGSARLYGLDASEIQIDENEFPADAAAVGIREEERAQDPDFRYETFPEMQYEVSAFDENLQVGMLNIRPPVPVRLPDHTDDIPLFIGGTAAELLDQREEIIEAFEASGLGSSVIDAIGKSEAQIAFYNLIDYVDDDGIPANLGGEIAIEDIDWRIPSVEAVPSFNEAWFDYTVNITPIGDQWKYVGIARARFEWAWMFPHGSQFSPFRMHVQVRFDHSFDDDLAPATVQRTGNNYLFQYTPPANVPAAGDFPDEEVHLSYVQKNLDNHPSNFVIKAHIDTWVTNKDGHVVDTNRTLTVTLPFPNPDDDSYHLRRGIECYEPRMNFFTDKWMATNDDDSNLQSSIGSRNDAVTRRLEELPVSDGYGRFMVADRPLITAAELGYLFYGADWRTIRLFRHSPGSDLHLHDVLNRFSVDTRKWRHGAINPNTEIPEVIEVALTDMSYSDHAGNGNSLPGPRLTGTQARRIAAAWVHDTYEIGFVKNIADIGKLDTVFHETLDDAGLFGGAVLTTPQKEALLRNAAGLFHPRQNHFTIVAAVNTFGVAGQIIGMRRMLVEVWRDPFPDQTGRHRVTLRYLRWIE